MKKHLLYLIVFILIFSSVFSSLLLNISTNLIDWRDYAYLTWIINQNLNHLRLLDFQNLFDLNAFYPYTNSLFLSDTLLFPSVLGILPSFFTKNPITIFNIIFLSTFLLNYIAAYLFFNKIFKSCLISFAGSLAVVFSPFFYTEIGHFQMQNYWPFLIILYMLFSADKKFHFNEILIGILVAIQFLASVYLAFFGLTAIFIFFLAQIYKKHNYKVSAFKFLVIIITFLILDGVFIKGYITARKNFDIKRDIGEYLVYSAKIPDYLFPRQNGIFYQNAIVRKWQSYNSHPYGEPAIFPGFILGSLAIFGLVRFQKSKKDFSLHFSITLIDLFFLFLMVVGFTFSLGLPYLPFAKYVPLFDAIRGTSRWSFLFYIGIIYFAILYLNRIKARWVLILLTVLLLGDVLPAKLTTYKESYLSKNDPILKSICQTDKTVILEIPVTHFDTGNNIAEGLSYITKREMASLYNGCYLVNGYSGYDLPSIQKIKDGLIDSSAKGNTNEFIAIVKESQANILSVNEDMVLPRIYPLLADTLTKLEKAGKLKQIKEGVYQVN